MSRSTPDSALTFLPFAYGAFTLSGQLSQNCSARSLSLSGSPYPAMLRMSVWALPISLAATLEIDVSFSSSGYLDVSVRRVPLHGLWIQPWIRRVLLRGFPHSDICGSKRICRSPQLFAAYHVFLRLSVPRHPPCALFCLTSSFSPLPCIALHEKGSFYFSLSFFDAVLFAQPSDVSFL